MDNEGKREKGSEIIIDYEKVDVASIMEQIKRQIASQPGNETKEMREEKGRVIPPPPRSPWEVEPSHGRKVKLKRILLKITRPLAPLIKLAVFPVHQELRETVLKLHHANMRLDYLSASLEQELAKLSQTMNERIDVVNEALQSRLNLAFEDINRLKEYTKLLHNLSHNMVVEMSKLKIELDTLKTHHRILEKEFRHLEQRERWLEKEINS
ncbi:MAG: hypothetical protein ACUVR0_02170 [Candidatus Aminicenantales bacterium]